MSANNRYSEMEMQRETEEKEEAVYIFGKDLSKFSKYGQFVIASVGVFIFYVIYGWMQELIFRFKEFKPYGWYLTLIQFGVYVILASIERRIVGRTSSNNSVPIESFGFLSILTVGTMGFSNSSVGYLNYPTHVIFKSCKLIPTMIGGVFIQGKRYNLLDVTAVVCMSAGVACFTLADSSVQPNFNLYGVFLISMALCADGMIGNVQEKVMKNSGATNVDIIFYSYGIGFFIILTGLFISGSFLPAFKVCLQYPLKTYGIGFLFSLTGYIGIQFILLLVKVFGALPAVTVTTCRKAVTIILSFIFFAKPFTLKYLWSGLLVVFGIYLSLYSKNRKQWNLIFARWWGAKNIARHPTDVV